ncbi:PEP-utilizing enzyme [Lentzea sp. NPDC051838]|uniref:PEP-utilizing enzyme n=1 Tax=Lentzea sp. NPDC051838 TaxID=3154849 RepID=UPI003424855A
MNSFVTDWEINERLPFYTRANAGEVLADPASPLGWTLVFERGLLVGWRQGFIDFGVYRESELDTERPPLVGMFGGYFYLNLSHMRLMAIRMGSSPEALDAAYLGKREGVPAHRPHPGDADAECSAKIAENMAWAMTAESFSEIDADQARARAARENRPDLSSFDDSALVGYMRSFLPELATAFHRHDYTALASTVGPAVLGQLLAGIGKADLVLDLLSGYGDVDSAEPSFALWDLARTMADSPAQPDGLTEFLRRHGCRGPNEWDIHAPSWEAKPELVIALLDRLRHAPEDASPWPRVERLRARREAAANEVREALRDDEASLGQFELALRSASVFIPARERTKTTAVTFINEVRMAALELGRRGVEAGRLADAADVMMLLESELDSYAADPAPFTEVLSARLADYRALHRLDPPFIIADQVEPLSQWASRDAAATPAAPGTVLTGAPGSHGVHEGRVRVIRDVADPSALRPGEVVVAPLLDAAWTPLLMAASAVVADVGATNSHAAVICRELGVPLVVSATGASERLRDGVLVRVDGGAGTVTVLSADSPLDWYNRFLPVNRRLRDVCTSWQVLPDGSPNDHGDEAYDRKIIDELADVHADVTPVLHALGMTGHLERLETALGRVSDDRAWLASPRLESYHTVWMSLHEELLRTLGISRAEDAEREGRL